MNRITTIIGLSKESRTSTLLEIFRGHDAGDLIRKVFIACVENVNELEINEKKLFNRISLGNQEQKNSVLEIIDDEEDLIEAIKKHVAETNCVFYIDDSQIIYKDFFKVILDLSNKYPNEECSNTFDVVYTTVKGR